MVADDAVGKRVSGLQGNFLLPGIGFDRVFDNAPVGLCILDDQFRFVYLNQALADLNGVPVSEHYGGRTPWEVVPDLGEQAETALRKVLATGEPLLNIEFVGETLADPGVTHTWEENWMPLVNDVGCIVGVCVYAVDITMRKKAQAQLRQSEAEALSLVEKLKQEDRNKSAFIASLSHELRNPLAAIVGSLDILRVTCGENSRLLRTCEIIRRQTNQLTHLINDLLDVTRINSNKIVLIVQPLDLVSLVHSLIVDHTQRYHDKDVTLTYTADAEKIEIVGDQIRLTQVISNLIDNAYKFTKTGDRVQVAVRRDQTTNEAVVSVSDTGIGLSSEQIKSLFHAFYQVHQALDRAQGGLGLGLAIVKGLVEMHHGTVSVESEGLGKGTTFTIRLPIYEQSSE